MEYVEDFFTHGVKAFTTPRVPKDHYIRIEAKGRVKKVAVSAEHPLQEVKVGQRAVMSFLVRACRGTKRILRPCAHKTSPRTPPRASSKRRRRLPPPPPLLLIAAVAADCRRCC